MEDRVRAVCSELVKNFAKLGTDAARIPVFCASLTALGALPREQRAKQPLFSGEGGCTQELENGVRAWLDTALDFCLIPSTAFPASGSPAASASSGGAPAGASGAATALPPFIPGLSSPRWQVWKVQLAKAIAGS